MHRVVLMGKYDPGRNTCLPRILDPGHSVMASSNMTCDIGEMRSKDDYHAPWGSDWNKPSSEIKRECCRRNRGLQKARC